MKVGSICPSLYHLNYFKYVEGEHKYPKISFEKSQYTYHIILVEKGTFDVSIGGSISHLEAADALYLLPGDVYRILPCGVDFSLYNLFFDFFDCAERNDHRYQSCVFMQSFDTQMCLPRVDFEDAAALNKSRIFKHVFEKSFKSPLYIHRTDAVHHLYERSMLLSVLADMLSSEGGGRQKSTTQRILEYIRCNPENDLSGEALSAFFSYHKNHINKLIKRETGKSLSEHVRYAKIEHAKTLILEEGCSLSEISVRLGYFDYSHFYKAFNKETGITPTEYIKRFGFC